MQGYTLGEACQLARSSLPSQRVSACTLLQAVLTRGAREATGSFMVVSWQGSGDGVVGFSQHS